MFLQPSQGLANASGDLRDATVARLEPVFSRLCSGNSSAIDDLLELTEAGATLLIERRFHNGQAVAIARQILTETANAALAGRFNHCQEMTAFILASIHELPVLPESDRRAGKPGGTLSHVLSERMERLSPRDGEIVRRYFGRREHPDIICEDMGINGTELSKVLSDFQTPVRRAGAARA